MDSNSRVPLHRQVRDFLRKAILDGDLAPGARLPSTRSLARQWGLSRNTVLTAYEELTMEGLITARIGSGSRVRGRLRVPRLPDPRAILRESHYPAAAVPLRDAEGNPIYIYGCH